MLRTSVLPLGSILCFNPSLQTLFNHLDQLTLCNAIMTDLGNLSSMSHMRIYNFAIVISSYFLQIFSSEFVKIT
jgi:hypothetical protein